MTLRKGEENPMYETPTRQPLIQTHMAKKHTHTHFENSLN